MAWTVRLEDEDGILQSEQLVIVECGSLPKDGSFPISAIVESAPCYDTLLNPVQAAAFLDELNSSMNEDPAAMIELRSLTVRATQPHMYLRFLGD